MDKNYFPAVLTTGVNNLKAPVLQPDVFGMNFFKRDKKGRWTHRL